MAFHILFLSMSQKTAIVLTALGTIAGCTADPGICSSILGIDRGIVGSASTDTPGSHTMNSASNTERTTRVTLQQQSFELLCSQTIEPI